MLNAVGINLGKVVTLCLSTLVLTLRLRLLRLSLLFTHNFLRLGDIDMGNGSHSKRHSYGIRCEIDIIIKIVITMLSYFICKDGELSLLLLLEHWLFSCRSRCICFSCRGAYLSLVHFFNLICHH